MITAVFYELSERTYVVPSEVDYDKLDFSRQKKMVEERGFSCIADAVSYLRAKYLDPFVGEEGPFLHETEQGLVINKGLKTYDNTGEAKNISEDEKNLFCAGRISLYTVRILMELFQPVTASDLKRYAED